MARAGDTAFADLFRAHYAAIARAAFLVVGDTARADEIAAEAFAALWRHWHRVGRYDRPDAWVRRVAVRLAVRTARRDRHGVELVDRTAPREAVSDTVPDVDLARAIAELSPHQRACVVLHYLHDLPVAEVATTLGQSTSTVKQHLFRARRRLAAALGEHAEEIDHVG